MDDHIIQHFETHMKSEYVYQISTVNKFMKE